MHQGIESLDQLNDWFAAWAEQVANRRVHAETGQVPIDRFCVGGPHRQAGRPGADPGDVPLVGDPAGDPGSRPSRWKATPTLSIPR
jgi:hypothetical protein